VALSEELTAWWCVLRNASTRVCDVWIKLSTAARETEADALGAV